jgi:hypothetical protein
VPSHYIDGEVESGVGQRDEGTPHNLVSFPDDKPGGGVRPGLFYCARIPCPAPLPGFTARALL